MKPAFDQTPRLVVIDESDVVCAGIRYWCEGSVPRVDLVGQFSSADEFLADRKSPTEVGVVVLDVEPGGRRLDFVSLQRVVGSGFRVIVYSRVESDEIVLRCLDLAAMAYITKIEGRQHLMEAVHDVANGGVHVSPTMARALNNDRRRGRPRLSPREQEVLIAWFRTGSKEAVGKQLLMSQGSVKTYLQRIRAKYAAVGRPAPTKAALVARAVQDGIINIDDL